jgi:carbamoyl-phosphate synthase large subunit
MQLPRGTNTCNVMLSAAGRRVALMRLLEQSIADLEIPGGVLAMDIHPTSPAMQLAREAVTVPPYRDPQCLPALLGICRDYGLRLIVPTIDPELTFYSEHQDKFRLLGCRINISSPQTIEIGFDKQKTHAFLLDHGFPTVWQATLQQVLESKADIAFPLIVKPRSGSSSIGITIARTHQHLEARSHEAGLLVQSIAQGQEYTVDVFVDRNGRCRCAVPRRRIETRAGEVSKAVTVRHAAVADLARRVAQALPGAFGVLNIQIFHDPRTDQLAVIEINPRFGGGYPLSHQAGAPMTRWLLEDVLDMPSGDEYDRWRAGLVMLRYDEAVFVEAQQAGVE